MIDNDYRLPSYMTAGDGVFIPGLKKDEVPSEVKILAGQEVDGEAVEIKVGGVVPVANARDGKGWVETPAAKGKPADGKYPVLAMDCEMVGFSSTTRTRICS